MDTLPWLNRLFLIHIFGLSQEFPVQFNEKSGFLSPHKIFGTVFDFPQIWRKLWALATNLIWLETFLVQKVSPLSNCCCTITISLSALAANRVASSETKRKLKRFDIFLSRLNSQSNYHHLLAPPHSSIQLSPCCYPEIYSLPRCQLTRSGDPWTGSAGREQLSNDTHDGACQGSDSTGKLVESNWVTTHDTGGHLLVGFKWGGTQIIALLAGSPLDGTLIWLLCNR